MHRWFNDPRVTADLVGGRDSFTEEDARGWVERAMDSRRDRKWAILLDGGARPVGFVALFGLDRETGPELAVLVGDPEAWGKGVAREAERQACAARVRRSRDPPHPRRDPGHEPGRAEGRHAPRVPA